MKKFVSVHVVLFFWIKNVYKYDKFRYKSNKTILIWVIKYNHTFNDESWFCLIFWSIKIDKFY